MRVLIDTNVVLDVLRERTPHVVASTAVLAAVESGRVTGLLGATTVTTLHYLTSQFLGVRRASRHIKTLLSLFEIAPVDMGVLRDAFELEFADYEDAVLHEAARRSHAEAIVTGDQSGFKRATLPVYAPAELLAILK